MAASQLWGRWDGTVGSGGGKQSDAENARSQAKRRGWRGYVEGNRPNIPHCVIGASPAYGSERRGSGVTLSCRRARVILSRAAHSGHSGRPF